MRTRSAFTLAAAGLLLAAGLAEAKPAQCETSDEGRYACDFQVTDRKGSFRISAPGRPTYRMEVDAPGQGFAFARLGGRDLALPGPHRQSRQDPACWVSEATGTRICAR
ncbi:hypothetical protein [Enterovirga sp.]|uniref:hypothetical protein n=1 Tax=Enterovirga sp. TaxID=2026350 RepID=UPI00260BBC35|nr:hypothetical protein [Enterovirga sp.]MDB5590855.1 hypothetical protein [Enterovirga sp.]